MSIVNEALNVSVKSIDTCNSEESAVFGSDIVSRDGVIIKYEKSLLIEQLNQDFSVYRRVIYLESEVDIGIPSFLQQRVDAICQISGDFNTPITIEITSYGGDAYAALAIVDLIESLPMKINMHGRGPVMSAAAIILVNATGIRSIGKRTKLMLHPVSASSVTGNTDAFLIEAKQIQTLDSTFLKMIADHSKKSLEFWKNKITKNVYMEPEEALGYGLIDEIR